MPVFIQEFLNDERPELTRGPVRVSDGRNQRRVTLREVFHAGREAAIYRDNADAQQAREREAYRRRIEALAPIIGRGPTAIAGFRNPTDIWAENVQASRMQGGAFTIERQKRMFADALDDLARKRPDIDPRLVASMDDDIQAVGLGASADLVEIKDRRSHQSRLKNLDTEVTALAGGFAGFLSDPLAIPQFVAGILSGGTSLVGKNVAQQVLITGAREATAGVAMEAALQGVRKSNEEALGQEYGLREAAGNLAGAAIGGAVVGGAGEALGAAGRKLLTGRALPLNEPVVIEPARPNQARAPDLELPEGLARTIEPYVADTPDAPVRASEGQIEALPKIETTGIADDGNRPFGFVPPDSERLVDWEKAFGDYEVPPDIRAALGVIEAENASVAASRATPAPYRVPDADVTRAIQKAYAALELGEPLPAPALPRRFADLPEGADASMPMHPDEAMAAAAVWRATGEHPALAAGDPALLDLIEDLGRLSNATFDQVSRGDLPEDMGAVIGSLAWNRPDTHQELASMLIDADVGDVAIAREMVSNRLADLTPDASGALLGPRALPVLPAIDLGDVTPLKLSEALARPAPALPRSLDDIDVMTPLESARAFAERAAQEQLQQAALIAKRKPDPDMLDGEWQDRVASMRAGALRDLAILDKGGLPESGYQALDDVMRARGKAIAPKRRAKPIEVGNDAAKQQAKDAAVAGRVDDSNRIKDAQSILYAQGLTTARVTEIGARGPVVMGLAGQNKAAIDFVQSAQTGRVVGAFNFEGLPPVDAIWGGHNVDKNSGIGLAHIVARDGRERVIDALSGDLSAFKVDGPDLKNPGSFFVTDGRVVLIIGPDRTAPSPTMILTGVFVGKDKSGKFGKAAERYRQDELSRANAKSDVSTGTVEGGDGSPSRATASAILDLAPKINDDTQLDLIDMIVDPDGIVGNVDNPGAMTARDAAKVAARDDFMVERFRGCIL
jgi:hypothetical protein